MALDFDRQGGQSSAPSVHDAVARFNRVALEAYLTQGGDVNIVTADAAQETLLHVCIRHYGTQTWNPIPDMLLAAGANINAQNGQGDTPLHYAVAFSSPTMAKWCLLNRADCWIRNNDGSLPVEASIRLASREEAVDTTAQSVTESVQEWTALDDPAERRRLTKDWEMELTKEKDQVYGEMFAAAEKAIEERNLQSLKLCVESKGIDVNYVLAPERIGRTMLMTAARCGDIRGTDYLLTRKANPRAADARGFTSLHYVVNRDVRSDHLSVVHALLAAGADPLARDSTPAKATPLELIEQLQARGTRDLVDLKNILTNAQTGKLMKSTRHRSPDRLNDKGAPSSPRKSGFGSLDPDDDYRLEQTAIEHMNDTISHTELKSTLRVGDMVEYNGKPALVKYVGRVHFATGLWVGITVDKEHGGGRNNGVVDGKRYFIAADSQGVFVRPAAVTKLSIEHGAYMRS